MTTAAAPGGARATHRLALRTLAQFLAGQVSRGGGAPKASTCDPPPQWPLGGRTGQESNQVMPPKGLASVL